MHTHKLYAGDLCRPHNLINGVKILLLDDTLVTVLGRACESDLLMVTGFKDYTSATRDAMSDLLFSLTGKERHDLTGVQIVEVLVTTGTQAGQLRLVPSFWLAPVVRAPR